MPRPDRNTPSRDSEDAGIDHTTTATGGNSQKIQPDPASTTERIARRAYQRNETRRQEEGRDQEDWLKAERELISDIPQDNDE